MKLFGIIGNPVYHSLSPVIMNTAFDKLGIKAYYIKIAGNSFLESISLAKKLNLSGINVTAPFKQDAFSFSDFHDEISEETGVVNTMIFENKTWKGFNTDYFGLIDSLLDKVDDLHEKKCLVIGAGSTGKTAIYALKKNNAITAVINRTNQKAIQLAEKFDCKFWKWEQLNLAIHEAEIIINTIPFDEVVFDKSKLRKNHIIFDTRYKDSYFEKLQNEICFTFIHGKNWLINQAIPAFKYFTESVPSKEILIESILDKKNVQGKIYLIGFMACGKSSVGKELAKYTAINFVDIDEEIEKKTNMSINEIFEQKEEATFRKMESEMLKKINNRNEKLIVACGGGIILNGENAKILKENSTIWLYADVDEILRRINDDKRPLLKVEKKAEKALNLFHQRKELYFSCGNMIIDTTDKTIEQVAQKIYEEISITF